MCNVLFFAVGIFLWLQDFQKIILHVFILMYARIDIIYAYFAVTKEK